MNKNDEQILAFRKEVLERTGLIESMLIGDVLIPEDVESHDAMINTINNLWDVAGTVAKRGDLEENLNYLQPIPYIVIKQGDKYFTYTRLEGGGESRLHGKSSLGAGGHMNLEQEEYWNFEHLLALGAARELEEEIYILNSDGDEIDNHYELTKEMVTIGLIYSNATSVDSVHLGLLAILNIPEDWDIKVKETDTLEGSFKTKEEIGELNLENWSKAVLNILK